MVPKTNNITKQEKPTTQMSMNEMVQETNNITKHVKPITQNKREKT